MLYLASTGSDIEKLNAHQQVGIMTSPLAGGYGALGTGRLWASDCDALAKTRPDKTTGKNTSGKKKRRVGGHDFELYLEHLERLGPFSDTCLFVVVPDEPGCADITLSSFIHHMRDLQTLSFPLAYVMQNNSEHLPIPLGADVAFLGGTDDWRRTWGASMLRRAREAGMRTHVGRVNSRQRMQDLTMTECDSVDGTHVAFKGVERGIRDIGGWLNATQVQGLFSQATINTPRTPFELSGQDEGQTALEPAAPVISAA